MPIHDWPRVSAGIFHHFHHEWISAIQRSLNAGRLPSGFYALAEQVAGGLGPDVLTLETDGPVFSEEAGGDGSPETSDGSVAVAAAPPKVRFTAKAEAELLVRRKNRVVIRHSSNHRVVAIVEIVSPGNKASEFALNAFVKKAYEFISSGIHLLVIDLLPPTPRDPEGIHAAIWSAFDHRPFALPQDKPLTLAAYSAGPMPECFVEPVAVGDVLPDMPVFLQPEIYVPLPLDETYTAAFAGVPEVWRRVLESR
jgi:hypothetical protein